MLNFTLNIQAKIMIIKMSGVFRLTFNMCKSDFS